MVGYGGSHQYRIWIPGTNKIRVSRDVRFVGEARDIGMTVGASGPSDGPPEGPKTAEKPDKVLVIYDTIKVLLPPRKEPISESESESEDGDSEPGDDESEGQSGHESDIYGDAGT